MHDSTQACQESSVRPRCEIDVIQTTMLRALASVHRLRIIHLLGAGRWRSTSWPASSDLGQATVSQHLAAMRAVGLVEATRDGRTVRYQLADPEILAACGLMRERHRPPPLRARQPRRRGRTTSRPSDPSRTPPGTGDPPMSDTPLPRPLLRHGRQAARRGDARGRRRRDGPPGQRPAPVLGARRVPGRPIENDHGLAFDAHGRRRQPAGRGHGGHPVARDLPHGQGAGRGHASSPAPARSTSLGIDVTALDPLVDSSGGIATFLAGRRRRPDPLHLGPVHASPAPTARRTHP